MLARRFTVLSASLLMTLASASICNRVDSSNADCCQQLDKVRDGGLLCGRRFPESEARGALCAKKTPATLSASLCCAPAVAFRRLAIERLTWPAAAAAACEATAEGVEGVELGDEVRPSAGHCEHSGHCPSTHLCSRGRCRQAFTHGPSAPGSLDPSCFSASWPNISSCAQWSVDKKRGVRVCESNNVPEYYVPAYCPFGVGQGYCQNPAQGDSTDCPPFKGKVCPCVPDGGAEGAVSGRPGPGPGPGPGTSCPNETVAGAGDVLVPNYQLFEFPLRPDPTRPDRPLHMYNNSALKSGNTFQVIGAAMNGVQIKGPAEANGFNVDLTLIPLPCGGHVTPPVGPGPVYHYHKAMDCLDIRSPASHGPLMGYAADGFGIYGFGDFNGDPVLDECHGHFGPVPGADGRPDASVGIQYHYHTSPVYNLPGKAHEPYFMGCMGPSKGRCNTTVSPEWDAGSNWCGQGCGFELCVQPGVTSREGLESYLDGFQGAGMGSKWLDRYSVNAF